MRQHPSRRLVAGRHRNRLLPRTLAVAMVLTGTAITPGLFAAASPALAEPLDAAPSFSQPDEPMLLASPAPAWQALRDLDDRGLVARRNGITRRELTDLAARDDTAWLDRWGRLFYVEPAPVAPLSDAPQPAPYPYDQTFLLHSKPGSNRTIYLDFDGHTVTSSAWQTAGYGLADPMSALAFDTNGDTGTFSNAEQDKIQSIWARVAEDYAPFDVDVTTEDPGYTALNRANSADQVFGTRVVITDTPDFCSCGGVAYVGVFDTTFNHDFYQPAWVFANALGDSSKSIAEAASHEAGHNVGLLHDGQGLSGYYIGHDPWAPIMGVGYYQPVVQFSKGEYTNPTNTQDDFVVMAGHGVVEMVDDHADVNNGATLLTSADTGVISSQDDYDTLRYVAPSDGTVSFIVDPAAVSPNLDVMLRLYSANSSLLAEDAPPVAKVSSDVASGMGASIVTEVEEGKKYYLQVSGDSYATPATGYSRYGSIGQFSVRVDGVTNDVLAHAGHLTGVGGSRVGTTVGATGQPAEGDGSCAPDSEVTSVWWSWKAETTGAATIDTFGSDYDTTLAVYTGDKVPDLVEVAGGCNDDVSGSNPRSRVVIDIVVGETYHIRVDGAGAETGKVKLNYVVTNELKCDGQPATIVGTAKGETLVGTPGADVILGRGGDDVLRGRGGADLICGGKGDDTLRGGGGRDHLSGGRGEDHIQGGGAEDVAWGGPDPDTLEGGARDDDLSGNQGADQIWGGGGTDVCAGGPGIDTAMGGCEILKGIP